MSEAPDKKTKKKKSSKAADGKAKNGKEAAQESEDNKPQETDQGDGKAAKSEAEVSDEPVQPVETDDEKSAADVKAERKKSSAAAKSDESPPQPAKEEKDVIREMDLRKLSELKEAFHLFDINHDGLIDLEDLKYTFATLGKPDIPEEQLKQMLGETPGPVDFDAFVVLFGHKIMEMDPENVFTNALATWDTEGRGYISEERIKDDLRRFGDRFTPSEIDRALEEAPVYVQQGKPMIDYAQFSNNVCGLRNVKKSREYQKIVESGET